MTTKSKPRKSKASKPPKSDGVFEAITAKFIESIEQGIANPKGWKAPWHKVGFLPTNASTGKAYKGGNVLALWSAAESKGYGLPYWATYKQWEALGAQVQAGEKSSLGIKWVVIDGDAEATDPRKQKRRMFPSAFALFNVAQVEGWTPPALDLTPPDRDAKADAFFDKVGATIIDGGGRAYYNPASDVIGIPAHELFTSTDGYYATVAHEHVHWTGAKRRLDRDLTSRFGDFAYAAEELVAELGAAFLSSHLGVSPEPREDHAHYLANWLKVLKADPKALWTAASKAQAGVDFLVDLGKPDDVVVDEPDDTVTVVVFDEHDERVEVAV